MKAVARRSSVCLALECPSGVSDPAGAALEGTCDCCRAEGWVNQWLRSHVCVRLSAIRLQGYGGLERAK